MVTGVVDKGAANAGTLAQSLNVQLANWAVAYVKLHHAHWYVKGPHFLALHTKFEELYDLAAEKLDELAERMLAIGLSPASTMKEYLSLSTLQEGGKSGGDESDLLTAIAGDLGNMAEGLKAAADAADESGDTPTADLLYGQVEDLQKQLWMLNATLGK